MLRYQIKYAIKSGAIRYNAVSTRNGVDSFARMLQRKGWKFISWTDREPDQPHVYGKNYMQELWAPEVAA